MKKLLPILLLLLSTAAFAQTKTDSLAGKVDRMEKALRILREFRIVSYVQFQFQRADTAGARSFAGGDFPAMANNRFMIRRGRLKLLFDHEGKKGFRIFQTTFQIDVTERGFQARDFWGRIIDPWTGWVGLQGGMMDRPFGFEVTTGDDNRESPERGRMSQTILPAEKDLGAELVIESPKTFKPVYVRLDAGIFNGTGVNLSSFTNHKDFIGRIQARKAFTLKNTTLTLSGGASYYHGGVLQQTPFIFDLEKNSEGRMVYTRLTESSAVNKTYHKRQYYGVDMQLGLDYKLGATTFRGEFIGGQQPGTNTANIAPVLPGAFDLNIRHFRGLYAYFVQTFKQNLKDGHTIYHDFVVKYDWYDPNTQVAQKDLSTILDAHTCGADIQYHTIGVGYTFRPYEFFQLQFYYDVVKNAATREVGFDRDLKDNVFTLRAQFKFDTDWFNRKVKLI
jgi:hypothetical protein